MISIPGISIWHPTYSSYSIVYRYYDMRNRLVTLSCSKRLDKRSINDSFDTIFSEIAAYRYDRAEEMLKGVYDFLKGPDYVFNSCKYGIHKTAPIQFEECKELRKTLRERKNLKDKNKSFRYLTMNGLFLPSAGDIELRRCETETKYFYRVGRVLYATEGTTGIIRKKSIYQSLTLTFKTFYLRGIVTKGSAELMSTYGSSMKEYTSMESWERLWREAEEADSLRLSNSIQQF